MKNEEQKLNESQSDLFPMLEEVSNAKQKYAEKKSYTGYSTGLDGVKSHWQDGVNWALNYVSKNIKVNNINGSLQDTQEVIEFLKFIFRKIDKGDTPEETVRMLLMERKKIESIN